MLNHYKKYNYYNDLTNTNQKLTQNYTNDYCDFFAVSRANICSLLFNATVQKNIPSDTWTTLATINEKYRPNQYYYYTTSLITVLGLYCIVQVNTNGTVQILPKRTMVSAGDFIALNFVYIK